MAQTEKQRQDAARQARRRAKLLAAESERDQLRVTVAHLSAELERLEADLGDALEPGRAPRCRIHGTELACPQCYQGDD